MPNQLHIDPKTRRLSWFLRTYHHPDDILSRLNGLRHYAYILHDKDLNSDGTPAEPHYHIILNFYNQHTNASISNVVDKVSDLVQKDFNFFLSPIGSSPDDCLAAKFAYLTHMLDPKKHRYQQDEIVLDDRIYWQGILSKGSHELMREESNTAFILDLFNLSRLQLAKRYGRDYIKNLSAYEQFKNFCLNTYHGDLDKIEYEIRRIDL